MPAMKVMRSIEIEAPPERVFDAVSDYATWTVWSPWLCAEPDAAVTISQDSNSVGSVYAWRGEIVGQGEIEHQKLVPGKLIEDEIRFLKPFKSTSQVKFEIEPAGQGTKLSWHMLGSLPWFMFFMNSMFERFISMDYERGLKMLKEWIETGAVASKTTIRGTETVGPYKVIGVRKSCQLDSIGPSMTAAFAEAEQKFQQHQLPQGGEGVSIYHSMNLKTKVFEYTSGFVVPESTNVPPGMGGWSLPRTKALAVEHIGSYHHLGNAWSAANQFARFKRLKLAKCEGFEVYRNSPKETAPAELHTDIYLPLKA